MNPSFAELIARLQLAGRAVRLPELMKSLSVAKRDRQAFLAFIDRAVDDGRLRVTRNGIELSHPKRRVQGWFSLARNGGGVVRTLEQEQFFVPAGFYGGALPGDRVEAGIILAGRDRRAEAWILELLASEEEEVPGVMAGLPDGRPAFHPFGDEGYPLFPLMVTGTEPEQGVRVWGLPAPDARRKGMLPFRLVDPPAWSRERTSDMIEVISRNGLPVACSLESQKDCTRLALAEPIPDRTGRTDLTHLPFVTIDGADARDFDDAIALEFLDGGITRLWVAIADVAAYVPEGGGIDHDAWRRGTSVYFPEGAVHMLPEFLSADRCSLRPGEEKAVLAVGIDFDAQGGRRDRLFVCGVIRSRARLVYEEVEGWINAGSSTDWNGHPYRAQFPAMIGLAKQLMEQRSKRGGLDLDLPEAAIRVAASGSVESIGLRNRLFSHRLIEEFMLVANEEVARLLDRHGTGVFRGHQDPDETSLSAFVETAAALGFNLPPAERLTSSVELQRVLETLPDDPRRPILEQALLRSLFQAKYEPDANGHFALALAHYCHFTSPIRRYPDLMVHRQLHSILQGGRLPSVERRKEGSLWSSYTERRAVLAEREMAQLKKCRYLQRMIGEPFRVLVTGVKPHGLFVQVLDLPIEGMVPMRGLVDDFYHFDDNRQVLRGTRSGRIMGLGEQLDVVLDRVDRDRLNIDFVLDAPRAERHDLRRAPGSSRPVRLSRGGKGGRSAGHGGRKRRR